jgi:hypothetical protein
LFFVAFNSLICYFFVSFGENFINLSEIIFGISDLSQVKILALVFGFNLSLFAEFFLLLFLFYRKVGDFGIKEISMYFLKVIFSTEPWF